MELAKTKRNEKKESLYRQRIIYPRELPWILRRHIYTGAMGTIYYWAISGVFLVPLARLIGMSDSGWAYLSGLCLLAHSLQIVSAHVTEKMGKRKYIWYTSALLARLNVLLAAAFAFLIGYIGSDKTVAPIVLSIFIVLASIFEAIAIPPWMSWLKDLVPKSTHATFMGRRSFWASLIAILVFIPIGYTVDKVPELYKPYAILSVLVFGCLIGFLDLIIHRTIPEPPPRARAPNETLLSKMLAPFRHKEFRGWMIFIGYWNFAMCLAGSIGFMYWYQHLNIDRNYFLATVTLIVLPLVGPALTAGRLGRIADRKGVRLPLALCHFIWATLPIYWVVSTERTAFFWLALSSIAGAVAVTSSANIGTKINTRVAPPGKEAMYTAVVTFFSYFTAAVGAFLGGLFIKLWGGIEWDIAGTTFTGYYLLFLISAALRLLSMFLIRGIPEPPRH